MLVCMLPGKSVKGRKGMSFSKTPEISVIMPVYNGGAALEQAIESVLTQTMTDFELLLVDDGSTDGSAELCERFAEKDERVRLIRQKNGGICAARNTGMDAAAGRYLAFCDDDDRMLPEGLEKLYHTAETSKAQIARGGYELLTEKEPGTFVLQPHPPGRACRMWDGYGAFLQNSGPQFVWNALYRRQFVSGYRFEPACRAGLEDFLFNAHLYACTDRVVFDPVPIYRHFERRTSTSAGRDEAALKQRIAVLELWSDSERFAAVRRCTKKELPSVWAARRAELVTFLMHQLAEASAPRPLRQQAWKAMRRALGCYPHNIAACTFKQRAALILYEIHLQDLYVLLKSGKKK